MIILKEIATAVSSSGEQFIASLNEALHATRESSSPQEYEQFKRAVGLVIGTLEIEMLWPLYKLHPDLEPESLRGDET